MTRAELKDYHELAFREKGNFLRFTQKIGEKGMKKIFKFPHSEFSMWWFSLIAEKPTLKSEAYANLIHLLLGNAQAASRSKNIKARLGNIAILNFFKGICTFLKLIVNATRIKLYMKNFAARQRLLAKNDYTIVSYFPFFDKAKAEKGIFENGYFPVFHRLLEEEKKKYAHVGIYAKFDNFRLKDAARLANKFNQQQTILLLDEFFKFPQIFNILFLYFYFSVLAFLNLNRIKKDFVYEFAGSEYKVWGIFKKDFYSSFCGSNLITSLWYLRLFEELAFCLKKGSKVIFVSEMQWWEKALCIHSQKKGIMTIGYQHTVAPELLLNYYNTAADFQGKDYVEKCPAPDYLACVGDIPAQRLIEYGWPQNKVFVWGAQRFGALKDTNQSSSAWNEKMGYFVCAFSINRNESIELLKFLSEALNGTTRYKIILKFHPAMDLTAEINRLGIKLDPLVFSFTDQPLSDSCRFAKGMIVTESSSSFYAVVNNIPVIIQRFERYLDCNPLSYISNIPYYAYSPQELKSACDKIMDHEHSPVQPDQYRDFLNGYLYFPANEDAYMTSIDRLAYVNKN